MTTEEVDAAEYQHVVIFLHGVGGSGSEWKRFLQKILPPRTKLILPSAPVAPVDLFFGREMSSWYNMYDSYTSNILEVKRMAELFHQLIQDEVDKGVRPECIVLGGFSQGEWCVSVCVLPAVTSPSTLQAVLSLSTSPSLRTSTWGEPSCCPATCWLPGSYKTNPSLGITQTRPSSSATAWRM